MGFLAQAAAVSQPATTTHLTNPLPAPVSMSWDGDSGLIGLSPDLKFDGPENDILKKAFSRAVDNMKHDRYFPAEANDTVWDNAPTEVTVNKVKFDIKDVDADLQHGVDESYALKVDDCSDVSVTAETVWGALHALNTLEQLVLYQVDNQKLFLEGPVSIKDKPKYPYRGIMLDTARNFHSVDAILRQIDALAMAKMNVFHWHLTDTQSWPVYVKSYPQMIKDAFSPAKVYMPEDIKRVIEYARERGVRVIPELDLPGHSNSGWKRVNKDIVACGDYPWEEVALEPNPGQLEVLKDETYDILKTVYNDVSDMFPENFFHVGIDELHTGCYNKSDSIQKWLKEDKSRTYQDVVQYWLEHALPIFKNKEDRQLMMWQDAVLSTDIAARDVPKNIILQAWSDGVDSVKNLTARGYDVVVSSSDFVYLDCGMGGWLTDDPRYNVQKDPSPGELSFNYGGNGGSWCGPYKSWQRVYSFDFESQLNEEERKHVIGGSANLWSEQSDTAITDSMIWPRAAAYGELLWSGNKGDDGKLRTHDLTQRIYNFRERLVTRGVNAAPLAPEYCIKNPGKCKYAE
ncbi:hypothetical protein TRICI_000741 [Trichomonascus ciferrii]|uniref:Beta-hexosaminidase n=1 Tax=Trichomonascus ciferrii TaxID=44093 RepID=A0A642VBF2_9ASCO|nr:hypothetical protein TRICI_000741 [Trichomonascus ciferrii]